MVYQEKLVQASIQDINQITIAGTLIGVLRRTYLRCESRA